MKNIRKLIRPVFRIIVNPYIKYKCYKTRRTFSEYKRKYNGKRCFIVANGPSLHISDLNKLKANGDITFGMNRIYVLFDKTEWRPDFYLSQDPSIVRTCFKEMNQYLINSQIFLKPPGEPWINVKDAIYYNLDYSYANRNIKPLFGDGSDCTFIDGKTVTYTAIQLAVYMGFDEIYLLGCDSNYSKDNKIIEAFSYADERMYDPKKIGMNPDIAYNFEAYESARAYADHNNIRIYNATRGGMLEVFERVDFDCLF